MRKQVRPFILGVGLVLACGAAHAQPARERGARCRAASLKYLGPSPDKEHLTEQEEYAYEYEQNRKYLRLCGNSDDNVTRSVRDSVAGYESTQTIARLFRALRNAGSPESKDPNAYAALAAAYDVRRALLVSAYEQHEYKDPGVIAARNASLEAAADLVVDAYARALAACGAGGRCQAEKAAWEKRLAELYTARHGGSAAGLRETIDGALGRPWPRPPLPWWLTDER